MNASFDVLDESSSPWLEITRRYVKPTMNQDLRSMREAIVKGWMSDVAEKIGSAKAPAHRDHAADWQ